MEFSLRIITTSIILLWSIQTYKCTEGYKPGKCSTQPPSLFLSLFLFFLQKYSFVYSSPTPNLIA